MLPKLPPRVPRVLVAHNIEHELYAAQIETLAPGWRLARQALARDLSRLRAFELAGWRDIGNVIFVSSADAETAERLCPGLNALVVPPVFDYPPRRRALPPEDPATLEIGFLANFDWWPNRHGLSWFLDRVFPAIADRTRLHVFGSNSRSAPNRQHIVRHGFVERLEQVWDRCDLMICPVSKGGGVSIKVAEAVYNGMPILSTSFGARGLPLQPDPGVVCLDDAGEWIRFLSSPAARSLRTHRVSESCAVPFQVETNTGELHRFLEGIRST